MNTNDKLKRRLKNLNYALETVLDALEEEDKHTCDCDCQDFEEEHHSLKNLIDALNLDCVNSEITEENFPPQKVHADVQILDFERSVSSEEVIKEMENKGMRPANIYELLSWAQDNWNGEYTVVALGSACEFPDGLRYVPVLCGWFRRRRLYLYPLERKWLPHYRFAAVRKDENQRVHPVSHATLEWKWREEKCPCGDGTCPQCELKRVRYEENTRLRRALEEIAVVSKSTPNGKMDYINLVANNALNAEDGDE